MRSSRLIIIPVAALSAASCGQPEPTVISGEIPSSLSSSAIVQSTDSPETARSGRFIARCATEAEGGGVPGATIFTDGTEGVTDHCLSRYYIGLQPAPGAVYVPDDQAGSQAPEPSTEESTLPRSTWTPAQPRTDVAGQDDDTDDSELPTRPPTGDRRNGMLSPPTLTIDPALGDPTLPSAMTLDQYFPELQDWPAATEATPEEQSSPQVASPGPANPQDSTVNADAPPAGDAAQGQDSVPSTPPAPPVSDNNDTIPSPQPETVAPSTTTGSDSAPTSTTTPAPPTLGSLASTTPGTASAQPSSLGSPSGTAPWLFGTSTLYGEPSPTVVASI